MKKVVFRGANNNLIETLFIKSKFILIRLCVVTVMFFISSFNLLVAQVRTSESNPTIQHRIYNHLMNPLEHPDYNRYHVKPSDWNTFGNRTRFTSFRGFEVKDSLTVNYKELIEKYTRTYELGDILWPHFNFIFTKNLSDLVDEIERRDLFLFEVFNYLEGVGPGKEFRNYQFTVPPEVSELFESRLGDHWLGMSNGEKDGQYTGGYAPQMYRLSEGRFLNYMNFHRHFQQLHDDMGNKMALLVSLNFGHHFMKEGIYTTIGAETGQALPNSQVYYSFIRGAGKQYGVPWYGNASVFNRWGVKIYGKETGPGPRSSGSGPTKGTSLLLLKRLIYSHILYNCVFVGFERSHFYSLERRNDGKLSPVGRMQQATKQWIKKNGQPGVMHVPVAVMGDFYSGWSFPRHLYTKNVYRVWANLPYEAGDYLTDGILDMVYPGYQNSSYFQDESGFISPTPYGDATDFLLSDAQGWLLERYPVLIIGSELSGGAEIRDKLQAYVKKGGLLFITAGSLANLPGGFAGIQVSGSSEHFASGKSIKMEGKTITEDISFQLCPLNLPASARVTARCGNVPAVVEMPLGKGIVTVFASPFGISAESVIKGVILNKVDKPLLKPYPLLKHVHAVLDKVFRNQMLFEVGENLSLITCRKEPGSYTLGICNNLFEEKSFKIESHIGPIESIRELETDQSEKTAVGLLPEGFEHVDLGKNGRWSIAGGDIRIFNVRVREEDVESIPHVIPPLRLKGRVLPLCNIKSIQEEILSRQTFFEHFDGGVIDWRYLHNRDKDAIKKESGWINRQGLRLYVDLTSGLNLFPDLRLANNHESVFLRSMAAIDDVIEKMKFIGAHDLILSLHRIRTTNTTPEKYWASIDSTLREICRKAEQGDITVYLRTSFSKPPHNLKEAVEIMDRIGAKNLWLAPSTAMLLANKEDIRETADLVKNRIGLWIVSTPKFDVGGQLWDPYALIAGSGLEKDIAGIISIAPDVPVMLDGVYKNHDEEYLDVRALNYLLTKTSDK